jgi:hypothetical protein
MPRVDAVRLALFGLFHEIALNYFPPRMHSSAKHLMGAQKRKNNVLHVLHESSGFEGLFVEFLGFNP